MNLVLHFIKILLAFGSPSCCPSESSSNNNYCVCSNSYYLAGNKVCVNSCPSLFDLYIGNLNDDNICRTPNGNEAILFELKFSSIHDFTASYIVNSANSNEKFLNPGSILFNSPTQNSPLPTVDRGFYFAPTSSISSDQNYTPALYFTLNLWIKPLTSGEILNVISGLSQYLRIWADSSGVYKFSGIIYDTNNNLNPISGASKLKYTSLWHKFSITLSQVSCTDTTISFFINELDAGSTSISNSEAKFLGRIDYIWTIGNNNLENSFRGFIYWIQARSDTKISTFSAMDSTIECLDNQYWDGSACQNCDPACPNWPWCIRNNSCNICYSLNCNSCYGYSISMCTSCDTGIAPECCDYMATSCTQTWASTACSNGNFLLNGVCLYECPYGFRNGTGISKAVITADFTGPFAGNYSDILITGTSSLTYNYWNDPELSDPFPAKNRGLYFNSSQYLSGLINLSHTWSLSMWVYAITGSIISHSSGNLTIYSDGIDFCLEKWDGSSGSYSASQPTLPKVWSSISYSFQFENTTTTVTPYLNNIVETSLTIKDYVFRLPSGTLYLGKGPTNFKGFIAYFILWQVTINDFSHYYNINTLTGGLVSFLWPCDYSHYHDGSTCQPCLKSCTNGCTQGTSCYICDDFLCSQCLSFWPSTCISCISNTSCIYNSGLYKIQVQYSSCYTGCATCTTPDYYSCQSCNSGFFSYNSVICAYNCPSGYTENTPTKTCIFASFIGLSINFYDKIVLDSISGISVGFDNTNTYPNYDINDPYPAYLRGYYFSGTNYLSTHTVTAAYFAISIWIFPIAAGTILSENVSGNEILCLEILASGYPQILLILSDSSAVSVTLSTNVLNSWNFIVFTGELDANYFTMINSYLNSVAKNVGSSTNQAYFQDRSAGSFYIGTKSSLNSGFTGFLYDIIIYNINSFWQNDYTTSGCASPCSKCPIDHKCPDSCPLSQYNNGSSCVNCKATCTKGCKFTDSCRLCKTKQCNACSSFSGSCTECIINAEFDGSGGCKCKDNAFWSSGLDRCEQCEALCAVCKQTTYFECNSCITGKQLVGVICLNDCPYGFGASCSSVSTAVIYQSFDVDFQGSYGIFITGTSSSSYQPFNSPEIYDPIPAYKRGLYFDGNMYLLSSTSIYISHSFSIGAWIYVITNGDFLQKQARLIISSTGAITVIMDDTLNVASTQTLSPISSFAGWAYLSIAIYYASNSSPMSIFINGISAGTTTIVERVYRDDLSTNLQLGKSNNSGFIGFIYYFQLWNERVTNFLSVFNGFTFCGSGASCLWSCDIGSYNSGSNYQACNSCASGCVRAISCNICNDPLCLICTGFESGKCTNCVNYAAKNPTDCACIGGYRVSDDGFSCVPCPMECQTCTGGGYYQCTGCKLGYYLINSQCLAECPWGYTQNSSTKSCDLTYTTYTIQFSNNILLDTISGVNIGLSNTNIYPSYDLNDPYPSYLRGYYFNYNSYLKTNFMFSPTNSISLWIKPIAEGYIISKYISTTNKILIEILPWGYHKISLLLSDSTTTISVSSTSSILNDWFFISFDLSINYDGTTTIQSYTDGVPPVISTTSSPLYLLDSQSGDLYIGHYSSGFTGFLWNIKIYSQNNNAFSDFKTTGCINGCTKCPIDSSCPDKCPISQHYNSSICSNCRNTCDKGCRNSDTCRLCKTKECATCTEFSGGNSCLTCIYNAVSDGNGGCTCAVNTFWVSSSQTCEFCDALCVNCLKTAYFECSICTGSSQLVGNTCLNGCPYGFEASCSSLSTPVINQSFDIDFQGSYGVFITGVSSKSFQFFNSPEASDPIPAYKRGLYFDGINSILQSENILLSHSFSIGIWLYIIAHGDFLEKANKIIGLSSTGSVKTNMENPAQVLSINTLYPSSSSPLDNWNYLSFTFSYALGATNIAIYVNGAEIATSVVDNRIIRDQINNNLFLGGSSTSGFIGFINAFQLWNTPISDFSSYINDLCGTGLGSTCLWSCDLSNYWFGIAYLPCNSCSKGCVKAVTCNVCDDLLCSVCTGFGLGKCIQCVTNASGAPNPCICNANYMVDTSNNSACIPISPGNGNPCPKLCSLCISSTKCTTCVENASLKNDLCYCNLGYNGSINCNYISFSSKLSVLPDNSLYLIFSDKLANTLSVTNFTIKIKNLGEVSYKMEQINDTFYYISLNLEDEISKDTLAALKFLDLKETISVSNGVLNSSEIYVNLNSYDPVPYSAVTESVSSQGSAGSQTAISGTAVLSIINSNPSSLWSLMNALQILSYLTLSGIPFSSKISTFLNSLNSFNIFPNIFIFFIDENEGNTPYSQAKDFGFDSDLVLINQGNDFTLLLASFSAIPIILFFSRCSYRWLGKKFLKTLKDYHFSFYLRFWIQCYLELGAAASIGFATAGYHNATQVANLFICAAIYLLLIATPPIYFWFSYKNKNRIQSKEKGFFSLFNTFFYEFRTDIGFLATQYYFVFFARRLIYIVNLVFLREYPETQVTINIVLSLATIMHLWFFWPFKDQMLQVSNLIAEILVCLVMCCTSVYLFNLDQEIVSIAESIIVAIVLAVMIIQTCFAIAMFVRSLYEIIRNKLSKSKNAKLRGIN